MRLPSSRSAYLADPCAFAREQDFENYLSINDYSNAILLALSMDQPRRLLKLFTQVRGDASEDTTSLTGSRSVDDVIKGLSPSDLRQLLVYIKDWNTVSRTSEVAQSVLNAVLRYHSADAVLACLEPLKEKEEEVTSFEMDEDDDDKPKKKKREAKAGDVLNALIPYTERHFGRADKMVRESFIVDHLLGMMESFDEIGGEMDVGEEVGGGARVER